MEKLLQNLIVKSENGVVVILNQRNMHWIRMKSDKLQKFLNSPNQKRELLRLFDTKYDLFQQKRLEEKSNIRSAYISVTNRCNMRCSFCTMLSSPEESIESDLTFDQIVSVVIPKLRNIGVKKVVISGGEPLIRKDIVDILKAFSDNFGRDRIVLQTNGLLLDDEKLKKIKKYIGTMEISIENIFCNDKHLQKIKNVLQLSKLYNIDLGLSFVVDSNTKIHIFKGIDLCHEYGTAFTMRIVSLVGRAIDNNWNDKTYQTKETLDLYRRIIDYIITKKYFDDILVDSFLGKLEPKRHCGAFGKVLAIHADGMCYMCGNFKNERYCIGSIVNSNYEEILSNLDNKMNDKEYLSEFCVDCNTICNGCDVQYFCSGPCMAEIAENKDNFLKITEKCLGIKILKKYALYYYETEKDIEENLRMFSQYLKDELRKING